MPLLRRKNGSIARRNYFALVSLFLVFSSALTGGTGRAQHHFMTVNAPFELSVSQGFNDGGAPTIVISTGISYRRLVFFKKEYGYESEYRVFLDLKDEKGRTVRGEVWERTEKTQDYKLTNSATSMAVLKKSFPIDPGKYRAKVIIEVVGTSLRFQREAEIFIPDGSSGSAGLSDPVFSIPDISRLQESPPRGEIFMSTCTEPVSGGFIILPEGVYAQFDSWLRGAFDLVFSGRGTGPGKCLVSVRITGPRNRVELYNRKEVIPGGKRQTRLCVDINVDGFTLGRYDMSIAVEFPGTGGKSESSGTFTIILNEGLLRENFPDLLKILSYIADDAEIVPLATASPGDRSREWFRFWEKRDAAARSTGINLGLSEFLRRLRFSVEAFSRVKPGWETDRGRIYIKYGEPDKIQDQGGMGYTMGGGYQLWYYYSKNIVFIFQDSMGSGLYHLVSTRSL